MTPTHHPNAQLMTAVACGALSPAVSRILQAHATLCPHCRAIMHDVETVAASALDDETGIDVLPDALDKALAAIEGQRTPEAPGAISGLPSEVHDIVAPSVGKASWYSGGPGLKILDLNLPPTAEGETFQVFRIEPGYGPPKHTHGGQEFTLVLTGAFKDETGRYAKGDIAIGDESVTHRPVAEPGEVCFALAVTTAPLKFTGPLGVLQRVLNFGRKS
jgi:putative transcriptional regulator